MAIKSSVTNSSGRQAWPSAPCALGLILAPLLYLAPFLSYLQNIAFGRLDKPDITPLVAPATLFLVPHYAPPPTSRVQRKTGRTGVAALPPGAHSTWRTPALPVATLADITCHRFQTRIGRYDVSSAHWRRALAHARRGKRDFDLQHNGLTCTTVPFHSAHYTGHTA